jgi:hemerythrin-like domain-containing protein
MKSNSKLTRRQIIKNLALTAVAVQGLKDTPLFAQSNSDSNQQKSGEGKTIEVAALEDLMREHSALSRILLIYEDIRTRLLGSIEFPLTTLLDSTSLIRKIIEDYHEKLEEDYIFPKFEKAGKLVDLVTTLRKQHQAGRLLTDNIKNLASSTSLQNPDSKKNIIESIENFIHMYRPHKAREGTILFPAVHDIFTPKEYDQMGDKFEDKEHQLFGPAGFDGIVVQIAEFEKKSRYLRLGTIYAIE